MPSRRTDVAEHTHSLAELLHRVKEVDNQSPRSYS